MNLLNLILSGIVSGTMSYFSIKNLSKNKFNVKNMLTYVLILIPLLLVVYICFDGITRLLLNIIFTIMALYLTIFKKDISNSVYYALSYELLAYICEIIISVIFVSIFKINMNSYKEFQFSLLIFSICNCIFIYLLSKNRFICKSVRRLNEIIKRNNKEWIYILIIMIILSLLLVFNNNNLGYGIDYYINAGMVIFVVFSLIYVIYNKFQKQAIEDKYNESMEYVLRYEKIINDQGKKNHEYNNQLMVIKGYINNPERLSEYLDEVIGEHKTGQNYTVKQLGFLPDGGVKGLLYHKLSKMEDNNIKYYLYVDQNLKDKDIENFDLKTYRDLTKLLGVFLDNAIDAALKSEEKEIEVELKDKDDCLLLTISNTYDKNTDINKVGKSGFTTKGVGHGFGLSIVKDIAKTNSEIETFSSKESDKFIQTAMIYYKK
mgnify:FL=1